MRFKIKKKVSTTIEYNPDEQKAILKCSICNGEQVAGFKDIRTGKFTEVMLITDAGDLEQFKKMYNLTAVSKEY